MPLRVSQNAQYAAVTARLRENLVRLHATQLDLATGLRIRTPSDDPAGAARLLSIERLRASYDRFAENANLVATTLNRATSELESGGEILGEVRARIVEALNGTLSANDRASLAADVDGAADRLLLVANAGAEGRFLFAGSRTGSPPFARYTGRDGVERVRYRGDDIRPRVEVAPGLKEVSGLPGTTPFGAAPGARGPTLFSGGATGVVSAAGLADSARGRGSLLVAHTASYFGAPPSGAVVDVATGVALSATSAAGDTILGDGHVLALTVLPGGGGTATLNGGPPVSFLATDSDLAVVGPDGEIIRLDFTGATNAFSGTVDVGATGSLSTDGGFTRTPIDFSAPAQAIRGEDGGITYVDARGVRKAGVERVRYSETMDLFDVMLSIRDLLKTTGSDAAVAEAKDDARALLDELDRSRDRIISSLAALSGGVERSEAAHSRIEDERVRLLERRSRVRDVDITEAASRLASQQAAYEGSLLVSARVNRVSLLDYLR